MKNHKTLILLCIFHFSQKTKTIRYKIFFKLGFFMEKIGDTNGKPFELSQFFCVKFYQITAQTSDQTRTHGHPFSPLRPPNDFP